MDVATPGGSRAGRLWDQLAAVVTDAGFTLHRRPGAELAGANVIRVYKEQHDFIDSTDQGMPDITSFPMTKTARLTPVDRENLELLGLQPSDLLARYRSVLLVEGEHDETVIRRLLGEELSRQRVMILPVRGVTQLPATVDSRLLYDFTEATVVPIVDNVRASELIDVWDRALQIAATSDPERAGEYIRKALPRKASPENRFLGEFLSRAIRFSVHSRVRPFSFEEKDILFYLPVSAFTSRVGSWQDLIDRHQDALRSGATRETDWKEYSRKTLQCHFDQQTIIHAVEGLQDTPPEFDLLRTMCVSLGSR